MVILDITVVNIALPSIQQDLGLATKDLQWVITAYTLAFGGLLIPAGRAADLAGRRRLLRIGVVTFGLASLGCGLAPSAVALVILRTVQGVGAAIVAPAALALLTAAFKSPAERRRAVAWWTAAAAGGGASGWVLGGLLVEGFGWPAVFLVNVPLCAAGALLAPRLLDEDGAGTDRASGAAATSRTTGAIRRLDRAGGATGVGRRLDLPGATAVTVGLALLVYGLTRAGAAGPADPWAAGSLVGAAVALIAFALAERRAADPILPPSALRRPAFAAAAGAAVALTATTTPPVFLAILYQQEVLDRSALAAGLACAPFNLAVIGGSLLRPRGSPNAVMAAGLCAIAAGALLLTATTTVSGSGTWLLPAFVLMGAGLGAAAVASTASGTADLDEREGVASGVLNAAAQVGTVLGLALLVGLAAARTAALPEGAPGLVDGYRWGFAGTAVLALAAAAALTRSSARSRRRPTTRRR
jgi:MFS family permease